MESIRTRHQTMTRWSRLVKPSLRETFRRKPAHGLLTDAWRLRSPDDRRGVVATEFALILPLFLLIVLGCIDYGRFAHTYIAVTNAARAGAGFAIMNPFTSNTQAAWQTQLRQAVVDEMQQVMAADPKFGEADLVVSPPYSGGGDGRTFEDGGFWRIRVEVIYPFETIVSWPGIPNRVDLSRVIEMRGIR